MFCCYDLLFEEKVDLAVWTVSTGFCVIFVYSTVLKLIVFGR